MAFTKLSRSTVALVCLILGLVFDPANCQQKCKTAYQETDSYAKQVYDYIVVYNISSTKNVRSCVDFLENYGGPNKENFTFVYTEYANQMWPPPKYHTAKAPNPISAFASASSSSFYSLLMTHQGYCCVLSNLCADGVKYNRPGTAKLINNRGSIVYDDAPTQPIDVYGEVTPSGVVVSYWCNGNEQYIMLAYDNVKDLSKEVDEVAKGFTANPADYKISRDNC